MVVALPPPVSPVPSPSPVVIVTPVGSVVPVDVISSSPAHADADARGNPTNNVNARFMRAS
jgi:hypothetical protein